MSTTDFREKARGEMIRQETSKKLKQVEVEIDKKLGIASAGSPQAGGRQSLASIVTQHRAAQKLLQTSNSFVQRANSEREAFLATLPKTFSFQRKLDDVLGMEINDTTCGPVIINRLAPEGLVKRRIRDMHVGVQLVEVNGIYIFSESQAQRILNEATGEITLKVARDPRRMQIFTVKPGASLGLTLGVHKSYGAVMIEGIAPNGLCARSSNIQVGAQLLEVNAEPCTTLEKAQELIQNASGETTLAVFLPMESQSVAFKKKGMGKIGLTLRTSSKLSSHPDITYIRSISKDSIAEKTNQFSQGVELLSINGKTFKDKAEAEKWLFAASGIVTLEMRYPLWKPGGRMVDSNEDEEDEADLMKVTPRMAKKPIEGLTHHVASLTALCGLIDFFLSIGLMLPFETTENGRPITADPLSTTQYGNHRLGMAGFCGIFADVFAIVFVGMIADLPQKPGIVAKIEANTGLCLGGILLSICLRMVAIGALLALAAKGVDQGPYYGTFHHEGATSRFTILGLFSIAQVLGQVFVCTRVWYKFGAE